MSTYDNFPPQPDYVPQPGRHCGQLCVDRTCPVCGENVPRLRDNIVLGSE